MIDYAYAVYCQCALQLRSASLRTTTVARCVVGHHALSQNKGTYPLAHPPIVSEAIRCFKQHKREAMPSHNSRSSWNTHFSPWSVNLRTLVLTYRHVRSSCQTLDGIYALHAELPVSWAQGAASAAAAVALLLVAPVAPATAFGPVSVKLDDINVKRIDCGGE